MRVFWKIVKIALVAASTAAVGAAGAGAWTDAPPLLMWGCAAVVGIFAAGPLVTDLVGLNRRKVARKTAEAFRVALLVIRESSEADMARIGLNCMLMPTWFWKGIPRRLRFKVADWAPKKHENTLKRFPKLRPLEKFRIYEDPPTSGVKWDRTKGAIGQCWRDGGRVIGIDCRTVYGPYLDLGPEEWRKQANGQVKLGLASDEWHAVAGKYNMVMVAPIYIGPEFIGCVTLDTPWDDTKPNDWAQLWTPAVKAALANVATAVAGAMTPDR